MHRALNPVKTLLKSEAAKQYVSIKIVVMWILIQKTINTSLGEAAQPSKLPLHTVPSRIYFGLSG